MQRLLAVFTFLVLGIAAYGQRSLVVVDVETRMPIRGVNVTSSTFRADTTNWQGIISVPDSCRTLSLTHVNYESRILNLAEVKDTIFLISKLMGLPEVTVLGYGKGEDELKTLKNRLRMAKTEAQLAAANPAAGFDVLGLVKKLFKRRKDKKKERFQKILEDY